MRNLTAQQLIDARKTAERNIRGAVEQAMSQYAMETGQQVISVDVSLMRFHRNHKPHEVLSTQVYDVHLEGVSVSTTAGEQV